MHSFLNLLCSFCIVLSFVQAPNTGCDLITAEGKCFSYFSNSGITWHDARARCQTWGGDLASIDSANESLALHSIRNASLLTCWMGLNDLETDGVFVWSDGSNGSYRNWNIGEPNNYRGFNEECGEGDVGENLRWNDLYCFANLKCYYCSSRNDTLFGRIQNSFTYERLQNNTILLENSTLSCMTENKNSPHITWRYVDLDGNRSVLNSTTDVTTGVSVLTVNTDMPGYYSCQVTQLGVSRIYGVWLQDSSFFTVPMNASTHTYTVEIDSTDIQLLCQVESYSLPSFRWKLVDLALLYSNPLNVSDLRSFNSQEIWCVDTDTGHSIVYVELTIQGPPVITLYNGTLHSFSLLPPNINSASVTVLTQNAVLSTNLAGRWQLPDNSLIASNNLTFSTFHVTQGGVYKFYVNNWDGQEVLAIQIGITSKDNRELIFIPNLTSREITIGGGNTTAECVDPYQSGLDISWSNTTILPTRHGVKFLGSKLTIINNGLPVGMYVFECVAENMFVRRSLQLKLSFLFANHSLNSINEIFEKENATLIEINQKIELILSFPNTNNYGDPETNANRNIYETLVNATLKLSEALEPHISDVSNDTISNLVEVTSNLLESQEVIERETNKLLYTAKLISVVEIMERISLGGVNGDVTNRVFTSQRVNLISQRIKSIGMERGLIIPNSDTFKFSESVSIPGTVVQDMSIDGEFKYSIAQIYVSNTSKSNTGYSLGSKLLSLALSTDYRRINLTSPVLLTFYTPQKNPHEKKCVFLDGENSTFHSTGLKLNSSKGNWTVCESTHLTSFGVLIRAKYQNVGKEESLALSIISYFLLSCSLIALIISIFIFILGGKEFFKVEMNRIYFNYALSLTFAIAVFLFGIQSTRYSSIACTISVFLLHYFWMAVFSWGLCISIEIIYLLWFTSLDRKTLFWFLLPFGWGLPVPVVITTVAISHDTYVHQSDHCFLSYSNGLIWSFTGPVLAILVLNMITLIMAIIKVFYVAKSTAKSIGVSNLKIAKESLVKSAFLFPVLGAPWILLPISLVANSFISTTVFEWLFIIITTPSGVLFFLLFTLRNDVVRQKLFKRGIASSKPNSTPVKSSVSKCDTFRINRQQLSPASNSCDSNTQERAFFDFVPLTDLPSVYDGPDTVSKKLSLKSITSYVMPDIEKLRSVPEDKQAIQDDFDKNSD